MKHSKFTSLALGIVIGILGSIVYTDYFLTPTQEQVDQQNIKEYYAHEVATLVSPHSIRERMDKGDNSFILVDTRAKEDYEREHITGAINIDTSESLVDTLALFRSLPSDKQIIIYCYSAACMNGRKAGNFLAGNGVFVQEMTIWWNEWRYDWEIWNYDTELSDHFVNDYVVSGIDPGVPKKIKENDSGCPVGGSLGC